MNEVSLRNPEHRVESRTLWWWAIRALLSKGFLLGAAYGLWYIWEGARAWTIFLVIAAAAWLAISLVLEPLWRMRVHRWEVTDEAVYALSGWLVREWRISPLSRIQTVDAVQGPLEQLMRLSSLRVTTASSQGAVTIVGLNKQTAEKVAARLAEITHQTPGDAT